MGQVNVNPPAQPSAGGGSGAGTTILGMGIVMFFTMIAFVVLIAAAGWFVVRPMMMSGPATVNVTVPSQAPVQPPAQQQPPAVAPAPPARP